MKHFQVLCWMLCMALLPVSAQAITVVSYNSTNGTAVAPSSEGAGVTGLALSRGAGVNQASGSTFNSNNWSNADLSGAQADAEFIEFGFTTTTAYDLTTLDVRYDRSGTGPSNAVIQANVNGGGFQTIFNDNSVNSSGENNAGIDLSTFTNATSATFRIFGFGATGSTGTFDIENTAAFGGNGIVISGDASPVVPSGAPELVAFDRFDASQKLDNFTQNPAPGAFSSAGDGFEVYQRNVSASIPFAVLDDSLSIFPPDSLGIVKEGKADAFFGIVDLNNNDTITPTDNVGTAEWTFDVAGFKDLEVRIDMASMGDFEASNDSFNFEVSVDGGTFTSLFTSSVDEAGSLDYTLEGGSVFTLNDPLLMNGTTLSNEFLTLAALVGETGSTLVVRLTASTDGGSEAFAFDNIEVFGVAQTNVPEPATVSLIGLAGLAMVRRRRRA